MLTPEETDARILNERLQWAEREGAFLILTAPAALLKAAEARLLARFDLERRDLNLIFLRAMHNQAIKAKADWNVVLEAGNAAHTTNDWRNLMILISRSMSEIDQDLSHSDKTLLLVNPELLIRFGRIDLLERLREKVWSPSIGLHGVWALMKSDEPESTSSLDEASLLSIFRNQLTHIPECWVTEDRRS